MLCSQTVNVMAYDKLCRGEFSVSLREYTFLSTVSRYQVLARHIAGCLPTTQAEMMQSAKKQHARFVRLSHNQWNQLFVLPLCQTPWIVPQSYHSPRDLYG